MKNIYDFLFACICMYKNNSSKSRNFSPGHGNRHSKQPIYETNILNIFSGFKKFLTIFNSSVDYCFIFIYKVYSLYCNFNTISDDNRVIPKCILTFYSEFILAKTKNVFFDNFDYKKLCKTAALMVCFNSFNFSPQFIG